jgi:hypothetical protein
VADFVGNHPEFRVTGENLSCKASLMNVGEMRNIKVDLGPLSADVAVDVEPRSQHYPSHVGIFTRLNGRYIKGGHQIDIRKWEERLLPIRAIHQKVQHALLALSKLEKYRLDK